MARTVTRRRVKSDPMAHAYDATGYEEVSVPEAPYKPDAVEREVERRYKIPNVKRQIAEKKAINKGYRILKRY